jgi:glucose-6-phosphate isomerase
MPTITFDPSGLFIPGSRCTRGDLDGLAPKLQQAQRELVETDERLFQVGVVPDAKQPLDHGFFRLPERMLEEYRRHRDASQLGQVLQVARRLQETVDRVVVLGIGGSYLGARALMESCCQPYFNELSRADRGGKPRMYFEGHSLDNDSLQGLLHLLNASRVGEDRAARSLENRWALMVISKSGRTLETAVACRIVLEALREAAGDEALPELVIPVTGADGPLAELASTLGCQNVLTIPEGVGGRFAVFSSAGLLPGAVLGINVISLLEGAIEMNEHFRSEPPGANLVLAYVAACHLAERQGMSIRVLSVWAKALEALGLWHDQLLAASLGKGGLGATPLTAVNTRDLHSRHQQHRDGRRDKLVVNVTVRQWRTDPLRVGSSSLNQDGLNDLADRSLSELMTAANLGANEDLHAASRPTIDVGLPAVDESSLGQLMQMFMLATVVEGRLLGVNPYGQPGVEDYKLIWNRVLGRR